MKTSCRFCEFNISENNIQIGCEAGLIDKYKQRGIDVIPVKFDDERGLGEAFEIDRLCLSLRMPGWKAAKMKQGLLKDGKTYAEIARDEFNISVTVILHVPESSTLKHVFEATERLNNFTMKPTRIIFMNQAGIKPVHFLNVNNVTNIPWNMEYVLSKDMSKDDCFDLASKKVKTAFMLTANVTDVIRPDYIEVVFKRIVDELEAFVAIRGDKINFYQTPVYRYVRGHEQADAHEKIEMLAEDQECLHLLKEESEIFQN